MAGDVAFDRASRFFKHRKLDRLVDRNRIPEAQTAWRNNWSIDERVMVKAMFSWLDDRRAQGRTAPFFVHYNFVAGHHPYEVPGFSLPQGATPAEESAAQARTLRFVDDRLREIVEGLRQRGLLEDTLIAVVSDHGPGSGRPGMGRVRDASVYEGSVHVPFVLYGPQLDGAAGEVAFTTNHLDVAPTLLGLVGLAAPTTMKGRDLRVDDGPRLAIMSTRPPLSQLGVVAGRWKLVHWQETGVSELFDVHADPAESRDLSDQRRDVVNTLVTAGRGWQRHSRHLIENYAAVLKTAGRRCGAGPRRP
jgi:arylsulfatase A-like enzyme